MITALLVYAAGATLTASFIKVTNMMKYEIRNYWNIHIRNSPKCGIHPDKHWLECGCPGMEERDSLCIFIENISGRGLCSTEVAIVCTLFWPLTLPLFGVMTVAGANTALIREKLRHKLYSTSHHDEYQLEGEKEVQRLLGRTG